MWWGRKYGSWIWVWSVKCGGGEFIVHGFGFRVVSVVGKECKVHVYALESLVVQDLSLVESHYQPLLHQHVRVH